MTTPPPTSRVVRAFISSTFRDFGEERDLLVKRVFPELRRRARARFVEVIGVDLRWGITEEESQKGETLPICLREIERSRPYFIGLLGERYGWTPEAGQYPAELLAQQPWLAEHAGGKSVTELEILHGVLNSPEMAGRAYFYFRDPAWSEGKGADFRSEGEDERARLARLKERIRASPFPVAEYATPEALADRITEDLWRLIDAEYPESEVPDELERERRSHEAYAHERRRLYVGQEETVSALLARIEQASDEKGEDAARSRVTLVTGESGTGKSALIANVLERYRQAHPTHVVIEHYIGSTSDAADPTKLMRRLAGEIRKLTGSSREIEDDPEKLAEQFAEWLAEASWWAGRSGVKVVIALDALDKLSGEERLRWLPRKTAPHLRLVLSSLACEARETLEKRGVETLAAKPFTQDVARAYLVETLARRGRKLPPREVERIVAHPRATLPIYLRTLVEELSVFGTHEGLPRRITECLAAQEPDDLFEVILARVEGDLGEEKVRRPLEAIWASADGMSEDELVAFTGLSRLDLARLRLSLDDALYESGGLVRLAHAYMSKAVEDRYLATEERKRALHRELGLWWERQGPSARMGYSVDRHLYLAEAWDDLERCLTVPRTAAAVLSAINVYSVYRSWSEIADAQGATSVGKCIGSAIEARWAEWVAASDGDGTKGMLDALRDLYWLLATAGAHDAAVLVSRRRLEVARRRSAVLETAGSLLDVGAGVEGLGFIMESVGDTHGAIACHEEGLQIQRHLIAEAATPTRLRDMAVVLNHIGRLLQSQGDSQGALDRYNEGLAVQLHLIAINETPGLLRELSMSLHCIGTILETRGDTRGALAKFEESLRISRLLLEHEETPKGLADVSLNLMSVGDVLHSRGDTQAALDLFEESLGIRRRLVESAATPDRLRDVSATNFRIGRILEFRGDTKGALGRYQECLKIARWLANEQETPRRRRDLGAALDAVARILESRGDREGAIKLYEESLQLARRGLATEEIVAHLHDVSVGLNNVGVALELSGDLIGALQKYNEGLAICRRILEREETPDSQRALSISLSSVGRILQARGDVQGALRCFAEAQVIVRQLLVNGETPARLRDVSVSLRDVGAARDACGDAQAALESYTECLDIRRRLAREEETPERLSEVSEILGCVGRILESGGDRLGAVERYSESLDIQRRLLEADETPDTLNGRVWTAHLLASCLVDLGRIEEARSILDEAQANARDLEAACEDDQNVLDSCAAFHETFARAFARLGRLAEASLWAEKAATIRARIRELL